jgi:hypothetical protein
MRDVTPPKSPVPFAAAAYVLIALLSACTEAATSPGGSASLGAASFAAEVASSDLYVGKPQAVEVGVFANTAEQGVQLVTFGTVSMAFAPYEGGTGSPVDGQGHYIAAPGTTADSPGPTLSAPSSARGVYAADGVTFDAAGVWKVSVTFTVDGLGPYTVDATPFNVTNSPLLPAPGDKALPTENLTMASDVPPGAIDSRAAAGGKVPDPELHQHTIAESIRLHHPVLVGLATPVYCVSQFCGPVTDALEELAREYPTKADFIHIEIWKKYDTVINQAAADWLYRNEDLTEPWLYLIDAKGIIVARWGPLFDPDEVGDLLAAMPDMKG